MSFTLQLTPLWLSGLQESSVKSLAWWLVHTVRPALQHQHHSHQDHSIGFQWECFVCLGKPDMQLGRLFAPSVMEILLLAGLSGFEQHQFQPAVGVTWFEEQRPTSFDDVYVLRVFPFACSWATMGLQNCCVELLNYVAIIFQNSLPVLGVIWDALCISASIISISCQRDGRKWNKKSKI